VNVTWPHHVWRSVPAWWAPEVGGRAHHVPWGGATWVHHHVRKAFIGAFKKLHVVVAHIGLRGREGTGQQGATVSASAQLRAASLKTAWSNTVQQFAVQTAHLLWVHCDSLQRKTAA